MNISSCGFYQISFDTYLSDPAPEPSLNSQCAQAILERSPRHARSCHPRLNRERVECAGRNLDLGSAFHSIVLEGEDRTAVIIADSYRSKAAQEARDEALNEGRIPLLKADDVKLRAMLAAFDEQDGYGLLGDGEPELSGLWQEGDAWCRTRPDWIRPDGTVINLKTTAMSAHPHEVCRRVFTTGGDLQAAMHCRAVELLLGLRPRMCWLTIETEPPFGLSFVPMGGASLSMAVRRLQYAAQLWADCLAADDWPGYPVDPLPADYPKWIEDRWLAREMAEPMPALASARHPNLMRYEV